MADQPKETTETPTLPPAVERALAEWDSACVTTLGPMISTQAYNSLSELRANLRAQITAALTRKE